jgi:hypothetical protein
MTDAPAPGQSLTAPGAARPLKVYTQVDDDVPILDTARFEHMQRIATLMAQASLVPMSLSHKKDGEGQNAQMVPLPLPTVVANCFLVTNQAIRWNMDPFAVASCASVVHGRLMWEGKLVAAVLEARLGVRLTYEFGTWVADTETVDLSKEGRGDLLGVRVSGQRRGDEAPVYIEGSVGLWKTTGAGSPWRAGAMKRQCRYRGAREWARAYESGVMLGVITDDELDALAERRDAIRQLSAPAEGAPARRKLTAGFGDEPEQQAESGSGSGADAPGPEGAGNAGEATQASAEPTGDTVSSEGGAAAETTQLSAADQLALVLELGAEARVDGLAREAPDHLDDEEKAQWLLGYDDKDAALELEAAEEGVFPEEEEQYLLAGERFEGEKERRQTYKDGAAMSTVTRKGAAKLKAYRAHAPAEGEGPRPTETGSVQNAGTEQGTSDSASGASSGSAAETSGATASEGAQQSNEPPPAEDSGFPGDPAPDPDAPVNPFTAAHEDIDKAESWLGIKGVLRTLSQSEAYTSSEEEGRRMVRLWAWEAYVELRNGGKEAVEPSADITLFRFWLEFAAESEEQINSLFRALSRAPGYQQATDPDKRALGELIARKKAELAGAKA